MFLLLLILFIIGSTNSWIYRSWHGNTYKSFSLRFRTSRPPCPLPLAPPLLLSKAAKPGDRQLRVVTFQRLCCFAKDDSGVSNTHTCNRTSSVLARDASRITGKLIASSAISTAELETLGTLIEQSALEMLGLPLSRLEYNQLNLAMMEQLVPGVTGRVARLHLQSTVTNDNKGRSSAPTVLEDEMMIEEWHSVICQQMDDIFYQNDDDRLQQPILLSIVLSANHTETETPDGDDLTQKMISMINNEIADYGLRESLESKHENCWKTQGFDLSGGVFVPTHRYEVDGAEVMEDDQVIWDTSSILVFDNLIPSANNLRKRMLDVVLGQTDDHADDHAEPWDDCTMGPDPSRWEGGRLIDLLAPLHDKDGNKANKLLTTNNPTIPDSYGLSDQALEEICEDEPPPVAFQEFEQILELLFPDFIVSRLPEAFLGASVTPLTANAPCFGQIFDDHIDADPYFAPPSPWTDIFGRYANRARGKPRFMSCLVYLNNEWDEHWGAPTRFWDVRTNTSVDVLPKPGRVVVMDQDITHRVVAPCKAAEKLPRYSLVWKLILHPKEHNQDMRLLAGLHTNGGWPEPVFVGSANRQ